MAILQMKKLRLIATRANKDELLKELIRCGCVEVSETSEEVYEEQGLGNTVTRENPEIMSLKSRYSSLSNALAVLDRYAPEKTGLLTAKPELEGETLLDDSGIRESCEVADEILAAEDAIRRNTAEDSRLRGVLEMLGPWVGLDMPLETVETERCAVLTGAIPAKTELEEVNAAVAQISEEAEIFPVWKDKKQQYVVFICTKDRLTEMQETLRPFGFSLISFSGLTGTAAECRTKTEDAIARLAAAKQEKIDEIVKLAPRSGDLKLALDKTDAKISLAEAEGKLYGTKSTVILQGWMPAEKEQELAEVFGRYDCAWETEEPAEEEYPEVPVKLKNNRFTNSLNMVTNMYSLPAYGTVDPNPLMAPFFILFFGLMMADIGYGIIMIAAALVAMKKIKPREGTLAFCQLLLYGGISTLVMGILTGGLFSDIPYQLVHLLNPDSTWEGLWYLFTPEKQSTQVLYGSMVLGVLHLNTGMAVSFVQKKKAGNLLDGIFEEGSLWVMLLGGVITALGSGMVLSIPVLMTVGEVILAIGTLMLLFGAGRSKKGFGKITAAFGCIYNTATGWLGDILSYARIMALMLAGGVVGKVFNAVAIMPAQSSGVNVFTMLVFVVIFLVGHVMNFALNLLSCYVHDLRLQCLEFFGKFYVDGGRAFKPLRFAGKYYNVKE